MSQTLTGTGYSPSESWRCKVQPALGFVHGSKNRDLVRPTCYLVYAYGPKSGRPRRHEGSSGYFAKTGPCSARNHHGFKIYLRIQNARQINELVELWNER
jgi:hypothetical protein